MGVAGVDVQQKRVLDGGGQDVGDDTRPLIRVERIWHCCSRRRTAPIDAGARSSDDWSMLNAGAGDGSIAAENGPLRVLLSRFGRRWWSLPARVFSRCGGRGVPAGVACLSADVVGGEGRMVVRRRRCSTRRRGREVAR